MRLIDADALMDIIIAHDYRLTQWPTNATDDGMFTIGIQRAVDECPTIEPPRGEWTYRNNYNSTESIYDECYVCSACGGESETTHPFCSHCGAKMKGGES